MYSVVERLRQLLISCGNAISRIMFARWQVQKSRSAKFPLLASFCWPGVSVLPFQWKRWSCGPLRPGPSEMRGTNSSLGATNNTLLSSSIGVGVVTEVLVCKANPLPDKVQTQSLLTHSVADAWYCFLVFYFFAWIMDCVVVWWCALHSTYVGPFVRALAFINSFSFCCQHEDGRPFVGTAKLIRLIILNEWWASYSCCTQWVGLSL